MTNYSVELSRSLRGILFIRNDRTFILNGSPVTYDVRPGYEVLARITWSVHGVCLICNRRSISCGRCAECAANYRDHGSMVCIEKAMEEQRTTSVLVLK